MNSINDHIDDTYDSIDDVQNYIDGVYGYADDARDYADDVHDYADELYPVSDVPFVPTDDCVLEAMLNLARVGPKDVLYDLGSGDGRIVIAAAERHGARAIGIEIDPHNVADAREYVREADVEDLVDIVEEDIFSVDVGDATVVTLYLLPSVNLKLRPRLLSHLRPGTRIVSHAFHMGEWKADRRVKTSGTAIYKWIVPARVAGAWEWEGAGGRLWQVELQQDFQEVTGSAWLAGERALLESAKLCGDRLELKLREYEASPPERFTLKFLDQRLLSVQVATPDAAVS